MFYAENRAKGLCTFLVAAVIGRYTAEQIPGEWIPPYLKQTYNVIQMIHWPQDVMKRYHLNRQQIFNFPLDSQILNQIMSFYSQKR